MNEDPTAIAIQTDPLQQRMRGTATHGNTPFDVPFISQIEGNLYQGGCENGLELPPFIEHVISLYPWEQYTVMHRVKSSTAHWLYDSAETPPPIVHDIARWVGAAMDDGPTLVHCQAGLNRSSLIAALTLMQRGYTAERAINLIREKRSPACLCNPAFEQWLMDQPSKLRVVSDGLDG